MHFSKKFTQKLAFLPVLMVLLTITGCASTPNTSIGSNHWHQQRLLEIEQAYQDKEITRDQYLKLKNDTDKIRQKYVEESNRYLRYYDPFYRDYYYRQRHPYE